MGYSFSFSSKTSFYIHHPDTDIHLRICLLHVPEWAAQTLMSGTNDNGLIGRSVKQFIKSTPATDREEYLSLSMTITNQFRSPIVPTVHG